MENDQQKTVHEKKHTKGFWLQVYVASILVSLSVGYASYDKMEKELKEYGFELNDELDTQYALKNLLIYATPGAAPITAIGGLVNTIRVSCDDDYKMQFIEDGLADGSVKKIGTNSKKH